MDRRRVLRLLGGAAALSLGRRAHAQPAPPRDAPNILFVMTDDQRRDAMGAYGNPILKTPHMDRLAAEGVRFPGPYTPVRHGKEQPAGRPSDYRKSGRRAGRDTVAGRGRRPCELET